MTGDEDVITEQTLAGESPGPRHGLNVTAFEQDYPDVRPVIASAMTLDDLAEMIDSARNGSSR